MQTKRKIEFIVMLSIGVFGFGWMFIILVKYISIVINQSGFLSIPFHGKLYHGIGELMLSISFFSILLMSKIWVKERVFSLSNKLRFVMITGGILNGLAWFTTSSEEKWNGVFRMWCLFLFAFGFCGHIAANWLVNKSKYV